MTNGEAGELMLAFEDYLHARRELEDYEGVVALPAYQREARAAREKIIQTLARLTTTSA